MALASAYHSPLTTRQLLISVQNAEEAAMAFQCGVAWVDLKKPASGSLGRPDTEVCQAFVQLASQFPESRISLALGEVDQVDWAWAERWLPEFAVGKVGLAGHSRVDDRLVAQLARFRGRIVPALYADWQRARSAPPAEVLELAHDIAAPYLLVDTWCKDGLGLFDWMSGDELQQLQAAALRFGAGLVVAGSLRQSDWPALEQLMNVTIGVRGAVCETSADRTSRLCARAIHEWLKWI